jgi:hypothetical protein
MKAIPLTKGFATVVDDEDYDRLVIHKWVAMLASNGRVYAARTSSRKDGPPRKSIYMHREILNAAKGEQVDHRDFDGLNNTRENLRLCNVHQNAQHSRKLTTSRFNYKGVVDKRHGKYRARICINGKRTCLGTFDTQEQAAKAYDLAATAHFGEFAEVNFPLQ